MNCQLSIELLLPQHPVHILHIHILADEGGELVVLFFLEGGIVERGADRRSGEPLGEVVAHARVVEDAVQVAAPAAVAEVVTVGLAVPKVGDGAFGCTFG